MWWQAVSRRPGAAWAAYKAAGAVPAGELIKVHHIRIKPKQGLARKAVTYTLTASVCYFIWSTIALLPFKDLDDLPPIDEDEEDESEPIFLPFPFTVKRVQPLPYAGLGEEWQNFVKFSKDDKLRQRVKEDLMLLVKKTAETHSYTKKWAKEGEGFKLGASWLIFTIPEKPPPEFVQWGLEIGDEGFVVKTKKLDAHTKAVRDRVFAPYPLVNASYASVKAIVKNNASQVAQYFGYSPSEKEIKTSSLNPDIEKTIEKLEARQTAHGGTASSGSSSNVASTSSSMNPTPDPRTSQQTAKTGNTSERDGKKDSNQPTVKDITSANQTSRPWAVFVKKYRETWQPVRYYPPRGSLAVQGMIALDSPKGRVVIDVFAWYHPKDDKFHDSSLTMNVKSVTPSVQRPRR